MVELVLPDVQWRDSYVDARREIDADEARTDQDLEAMYREFPALVARLHDRTDGRGVQPGHVPSTEYWIIEDGVWAGRITYRHRLTPALERHGGHIGYKVRPSRRGHGLATQALALLLARLRASGAAPARVLITCDETNPASRRVIEHNGGVLQDVIELDDLPVRCMRWWIEL